MKVKALFFVAVLFQIVSFFIAPDLRSQTLEYDTDRPGMDYKSFRLLKDESSDCRDACMSDFECRAFTYVKPGIQGINASCFLKYGVPSPKKSSCCISGVKSIESIVPQWDAEPYTVELYANHNYSGPIIGTWKLAPGMRMLKIPRIAGDKAPLSIFLGSNMAALLFPMADFISTLKFDIMPEGAHSGTYLIPYYRINNSTPSIPHIWSLIIYRKDIPDFLGVSLQSRVSYDNYSMFYPLPEKASESSILHSKIRSGELYTLRLEPGGLGVLSPPHLSDIAVTIVGTNGKKVKLPEPNSTSASYDLLKYGIEKILYLQIEYKEPLNEQAYLPKPPISAAPGDQGGGMAAKRSPAQALTSGQLTGIKVPDVSGQWGSNIGLIYNIAQTDDRFEWTVKGSNELGKGTMKGTELSVSWSGQQGSGSAQGKITKMDGSGRATQIDWHNGARFNR